MSNSEGSPVYVAGKLRGWVLTLSGWLLNIVAVACFCIYLMLQSIDTNSPENILLVITAFGLSIPALWLTRTGRRLRAPVRISAPHSTVLDGRPFVLYLRPFRVDPRMNPQFDIFNPADIFPSTRTDEEHLVHVFKDVGPMLTIARPKDSARSIPTYTGSIRDYLTNSNWQSEVEKRIDTATLIILLIGDEPNVVWELSRAIQRDEPSRLLILIPNGWHWHYLEKFREEHGMSKMDFFRWHCRGRPTKHVSWWFYEKFREEHGALFPKGVPVRPKPPLYRRFGIPHHKNVIKAAIYFGDDWEPHLVRLDRFYFSYTRSFPRACRKKLRPVIRRNTVGHPK